MQPPLPLADQDTSQLAQLLNGLSAEKRMLLALRNPLSFAQQRLWFIDQLDPGSPLYNIPIAMELSGTLEPATLEASLNRIINRHAVLRASFHNVDGRPLQVIAANAYVPLPVVDLSEMDGRRAIARRLAGEEVRRSFDLRCGPLLRARLVRLGGQSHVLLLTLHHIIADGWSTNVLVRELGVCYEAARRGTQAELAALAVQYSDYAKWQRQQLKGEAAARELSYWREQLSNVAPVLELPIDRQRAAGVSDAAGGREVIEIDEHLSHALRRLARRESVTSFMLLLAAFKALLYRYSGQQDVVVGTPIAGRTRVETEGLIGLFVNTLVLRTQVNGEESFRGLLQRVRAVAVGAYEHAEVPFEKLVEELQPERSLSHGPLVQVLFDVQKVPADWMQFGDLRLNVFDPAEGSGQFDLMLTVLENEKTHRVILDYRKDLFDAATIGQMGALYERLLDSAAATPDAPVAELSLLTEAEQRQVVEGLNHPVRLLPETSCIHHLFEARAREHPHAIALVAAEGQVSYGELNTRANRLAHRLVAQGVGRETPVVVFLDRGTAAVVAILAVLKAGGAYVPLDIIMPRRRAAAILAELGRPLVLTDSSLAERLSYDRARLVCLDVDRDDDAEGACENPAVKVSADNLAYVIYTSGSTGTPKGVMIAHGALVSFLAAANLDYNVKPGDRLLQFASLAFDTSVEEIFLTLTSGAALVVEDRAALLSPHSLLQACHDRGVTVLDLPTAYWHKLTSMTEAVDWQALDQPRLIIIGGERALPEAVKGWHERLRTPALLLNSYGPTEATIAATAYEVAALGDGSKTVPIGRPLANARAYVLDDRQRAVPAGVNGELYIGGSGLARGYLGRPDLTAERFVPDPYSPHAGARMYRSGDQCRQRRDGLLECLGRMDDQVKVRGFRIELQEVENALLEHAGVKEAAVVVRPDAYGAARLIGYVVPADADRFDKAELRSYLRERLPNYMMPAVLVALEQMPLTPNSKVNHKELPAPSSRDVEVGEYREPQTPMEERLARIWCDALGVERVSVEENFFDLGGHSLMAVRVVRRLGQEIGRPFSVVKLFEHPTIRRLAAAVEAEADTNEGRQSESREAAPREAQSEQWAARRRQALRRRREAVRSLS